MITILKTTRNMEIKNADKAAKILKYRSIADRVKSIIETGNASLCISAKTMTPPAEGEDQKEIKPTFVWIQDRQTQAEVAVVLDHLIDTLNSQLEKL